MARAGLFFWLIAGLLFSVTAQANTSPSCNAARAIVAQLQAEKQQQALLAQQLNALYSGQVPSPDTFAALLTPPAHLTSAPQARSTINTTCNALQDELTSLTEQLSQQDRALYDQLAPLRALSPTQRDAYQQLAAHWHTLQDIQQQANDTDGTHNASTLLIAHVSATWQLLPSIAHAPHKALEQLDTQWHHAPDLAPPETGTVLWRDLLITHLHVQEQLRRLRADLWQRGDLAQLIQDSGGIGAMPTLLKHESERLWRGLSNTFIVLRYDFQKPVLSASFLPLIHNAIALLLGISVFLVLIRLAARSKGAALAIQEWMLSHGEQRALRQSSRLLSALAPLLPWILLWFALNAVAPLLDTPSTRILLWVLPLAKLYVIYGLVSLGGEWLLARTAHNANVYLSNEQLQQLVIHSRRVARSLMLVWVPSLIVWHSLGPSLLSRLFLILLIVAAYSAVGRLLQPQRTAYLVCLQSLLPSRFDPLLSRLLGEKSARWFSPLLLPLALLRFMIAFLDSSLMGFEGYLRIKARWFRFRTRVSTEDNDDGSLDADIEKNDVDTHYEQWFARTLPNAQSTPYIQNGLLEAIRKPITRWEKNQTDDNTLVLTGATGFGKSQCLTQLVNTLQNESETEKENEKKTALIVRYCPVPAKTCSPDTVLAHIGEALGCELGDNPAAALTRSDEQRQPTLLILDDAQNLFLAREGGLEGWRTLLKLMQARLDNVFWLLSINNQSWAYLNNVFGRDYPFRNVLRMKPWSQSEVRSLILSRHHLSRRRIRYDESLLASRGPEAGNVRNAEQRYFSLLWDSCHGNPQVALSLWLSSISKHKNEIIAGLPVLPSTAALDNTGINSLFVYAAIASHENLTSHEIGAVTNLPETVVRYALRGGCNDGFLIKDNSSRYRISPLWHYPMVSYLARKNLLNE